MGYGTVSRVFHWISVLIVLIMIPVGLTMVAEVPRPLQDRLFVLHKGLGSVFLAVILARIAWNALTPAPPPPASLSKTEWRIARAVHLLLYLLLLTMAVSGYVRVTAGGFPIELLNELGIPPLLAKNEALAAAAKAVHASAKTVLIILIAGHVGAAILHALRRDGVMTRIWPPWAPRRSRGGSAPRGPADR